MKEMLNKKIEYEAKELAQRIDELVCAFAKKCNIDPRKCVLVMQFDTANNRYVYLYEKKRGQTRKDVLIKLKKLI